LYFPVEYEQEATGCLPWNQPPGPVVGIFAREQGALVPGRQVSSAKSWLSHSAVDRTARILPWGAEQSEFACSPVEASARYLGHIREAWNYRFARADAEADEGRFERQEIVLTVPASFDEEARELTVEAARDAGIVNLTLLEEPLAAFYAWMINNRGSLKRRLKDGDLVLICDVGGGTTDFSLIRVHMSGGEIRFERTAIGEHLLLGGDNVDLALARCAEQKLAGARLSLRQRNALARACCAAKERLLSDLSDTSARITILGSGRSVVGGSISIELNRDEVEQTLLDGFLPQVEGDERPASDRRAGLRELGLPYATEPAVTRHLAEFLSNSLDRESSTSDDQPRMARPDAVLFNGGFFTPEITRRRVVETLTRWFREKGNRYRPRVLNNDSPEAAVAIGAAYYADVRRSGGLRISGGSARAYYIGVQASAEAEAGHVRAVCVMPRGTDEGVSLELEGREFAVLANQPVSFTLYSSTTRQDGHGDVVTLEEGEIHRHAPLITVLRYGKKSRQAELSVRLVVNFTEVGTLELWCESLKTDHRWRLQFQLRGVEDFTEEIGEGPEEPETVVLDESLESATSLVGAVFDGEQTNARASATTPDQLMAKLEAALGYGKDGWPMTAIRKLCDVILEISDGRKRSARYEARWLNLFGFCLRPGFGAPVDDWRIEQARKIYMAGLIFPKDIQCQVEWLVLWRRVAGGLNSGQQRELYQRVSASLGLGAKKGGPRINPQIEYEAWRLLASLEHLPAHLRVTLGELLLKKIKEAPTNKGYLWSLGRLGARIPFYGPLNCVAPSGAAEGWLKALLKLPEIIPDAASAIVQLGALTEDAQRDVSGELREKCAAKLVALGYPAELIESLRRHVPPARKDAQRIFGESLPEGLRLVG
jgi:hypothetical protein